MRALIASPLGFLIGVSLGALGGGGSILAVPALVYVAGQGAKSATSSSLLVVGASALAGMVAHWRAGHVRVGAGLLFGAVGVGGSLLGTHLNRLVDPNALLLGFSGLMYLAAWRMWSGGRRRTTAAAPADTPAPGRGGVLASSLVERIDLALVGKVIVAGTAVGFLTGLFGVGGGFVIVPALVLALRLEMPVAVGTSLLVIAVNSAFALVGRAGQASIDWSVALPFTVAALAGAGVGYRVAGRLHAAMLVRWFVALLLMVATYTAVRSAVAL